MILNKLEELELEQIRRASCHEKDWRQRESNSGLLVEGQNNKSLRTWLAQAGLVVKTFTIVVFPEIERALV